MHSVSNLEDFESFIGKICNGKSASRKEEEEKEGEEAEQEEEGE
jgi:hypothetical protein